MYSELIKRLRERSVFLLPCYGEDRSYDADLMYEAADVIEELQKRIPKTPHGRLIDADALMNHEVLLPMDGGSMPIIYSSYIRNAPTIIEAEENE